MSVSDLNEIQSQSHFMVHTLGFISVASDSHLVKICLWFHVSYSGEEPLQCGLLLVHGQVAWMLLTKLHGFCFGVG